MNNQDPRFNDDVFGDDNQSPESSQTEQETAPKTEEQPTSYEYVFSNGTHITPQEPVQEEPAPQNNRKATRRIWVQGLAFALCVVISMSAGFFGAFYASDYLYRENENKNSENASTPELHHENPQELLEKADPEPSIYGSAGDEVFSVSQVSNQVLDTVVVVEASVVTSSFFGETTGVSTGSGVVISENGYIVTCNHVVENASAISVTLNSGKKYEAALVGADASSDLAVLRIYAENLVYAEQGCSADLVLGEQVVAIGNPLGTLYRTVTSGWVSGLERKITTSDGTIMKLLQTDAAVNSGNSGGGLFNMDGKLIGIVNAKYAEEGVEGLAFAIPIDWAYTVQVDLIKYGYVRGIVDHGLTLRDITELDLWQNNFQALGIYVPGVYVVKSQYCDDLKNADRIISVNGTKITSTQQLKSLLDEYEVGDEITIEAARGKETFTTTLTLLEYVPDHIKNQTK